MVQAILGGVKILRGEELNVEPRHLPKPQYFVSILFYSLKLDESGISQKHTSLNCALQANLL